MASAMRKMAVYLGLVEDDHRYEDQYQDDYGDEYDEYGAGDPGRAHAEIFARMLRALDVDDRYGAHLDVAPVAYVGREQNGRDVCSPASPLRARTGDPVPRGVIRSGPRTGVTVAATIPWRFWIDGEETVSPYRKQAPRNRRAAGAPAPRPPAARRGVGGPG